MNERYRSQVRLPSILAQWIKEKAKTESRSMNAQLVYELEKVRRREQEVA